MLGRNEQRKAKTEQAVGIRSGEGHLNGVLKVGLLF